MPAGSSSPRRTSSVSTGASPTLPSGTRCRIGEASLAETGCSNRGTCILYDRADRGAARLAEERVDSRGARWVQSPARSAHGEARPALLGSGRLGGPVVTAVLA